MIGLVLSMIGARRAQAITLLLLSVFATGAAVAGPVALAAVDRAIVANELANAVPVERTVTLTTMGVAGTSSQLESPSVALLTIPGFQPVFTVQHQILGVGSGLGILAYRDHACEHLTMVRGRCFQGLYETVLGEDTARRVGLGPGDTVRVAYARWDDQIKIWVPADPPATLTVVGIYRPTDPREAYWGRAIYFGTGTDGAVNEPVLADRLTLNTVFYDFQNQLLDQIALPGTLTVDSLGPVRAKLNEISQTLSGEAGGPDTIQPPVTDLRDLLDRIDRNRELADRMVPVAFVPLVALCWFVIYLAVSYGIFGRRHELGLVALRGVRPVRRWWLAGGETMLAILAGAPIGYLVGHFAVQAGAAWRLDTTDGTAVTAGTVPYALGALAGALIAAQLGQRAESRRPVADLLHRVPGRGLGWRSVVFEALLVVFAILAVVQLRASGGGPTGVTMLVPGLAMAAVAFLAARAVVPVAAALARRSLLRGRLGAGLAAVQLARRPGSQRLLVLVTAAVAMLCFVVAAIDVGDDIRRDRSAIASGASTVVTVRPVVPRVLLAATEKADPDGTYAMAVAGYVGRADNRTLAVDSRRLAAVAEWRPDFGPDPTRLAAELHPDVPESFVVKGARVVLTVTNQHANARENPVRLGLWLAPLSGVGSSFLAFGEVPSGRSSVSADTPQCVAGCRVAGISASPDVGKTAEVTFQEIRSEQPDAVVVSQADFQRSRWLPGTTTRFGPDTDGLSLSSSNTGTVYARSAVPLDLPDKLPVVATGDLGGGHYVTLPDRGDFEARQVARAARLPRLGTDGILVDLDYLDRAATLSLPPSLAEVWLGPAAPPDAVQRLAEAGLSVLGVVRASDNAARLDREGPAMSLWFHLVAAVFALVLALAGMWLVATVDRRRRAEDLRALRWQGLSRRVVRRATLWGQLSVVLAGTVLGLVAAGVAWFAAGDQLPVDADMTAATAARPDPAAVFWPWLAALGILVTVALIAAIDLRRAVARPAFSD